MNKGLVVAAIAGSLAIGGCATPGGGKTSEAEAGAVAGGLIGGVGTFLICRLAGRSPSHCAAIAAAGAAVGATIGWQKGKEKDLMEVKAMNDSLNRLGVPSNVEVAAASGKDDKGSATTVQAFKGITVPLAPVAGAIKSDNPDVRKAMQDLGVLSVTRSEPTRVIYRMTPANSSKVMAWMAQGVGEGKQANPKAEEPIYQELPYQEGRPEFVRVEPKDQLQFASR